MAVLERNVNEDRWKTYFLVYDQNINYFSVSVAFGITVAKSGRIIKRVASIALFSHFL